MALFFFLKESNLIELTNPYCPTNQSAFLAHHLVTLHWDTGDPYPAWGLMWKHGAMSEISLKSEPEEAQAIAAIFIHWWLERTGLDPGELIRAAWFFHNPDRLPAAKARFNDEDSVRQFAFVESQLARYAKAA